MVKFRGIDVSIISQFDIRKLPEFRLRHQSPSPTPNADGSRSPSSQAVASCYVPTYPGSQIWFEYCIDGPHPPGAAYFFKFLLDGKLVTSWDCTEKHDYHGKMMYNLSVDNDGFSEEKAIIRQALKFASELESDTGPNVLDKNVIEIRVHRIAHRKRVRDVDADLAAAYSVKAAEDGLELCNVGLLEQGLPCRRYKYQLLDPVDEPYATFRFFYRTYEFLAKNGILDAPQITISSPPSSFISIEDSAERETARTRQEATNLGGSEEPCDPAAIFSINMVASPSDLTESTIGHDQHDDVHQAYTTSLDTYFPPSDSDESLSIATKDSIEDLPSTVARSPKSPKFLDEFRGITNDNTQHDSSDSSPPRSPRRTLKKRLTVNINGADFDLEKRKRPLSPFTSAGMLRKLTGGAPPSAPASVTAFGPTVNEEAQHATNVVVRAGNLHRTTRSERGGKSLMGFLGRRIGTA